MKLWQQYTIKTKCQQCSKDFDVFIHNLKRGFGKYCSKGCSNKAVPRNWKGDNVGYSGVHIWIKKIYGTPRTCDFCDIGPDKANFEWANISRKYKRDREDWMRLCQSCHRKFDAAKNRAYYEKLLSKT